MVEEFSQQISSSAPNDQLALDQQFGTDDYLRVRQATHDLYSVPRIDFPEWALNRLDWRGDELILDVGSGSGIYAERLKTLAPDAHYLGLDQQIGMFARHTAQGSLTVGGAHELPFPDHTFDVVMANHMLYLVADVDEVLRELRRVMKPSGILMTATNSIQTMPEFGALYRRAVMLLSAPGSSYTPQPFSVAASYSLESAPAALHRHFYAVVRHDLPQALVFETAEPALAYLESLRSLREPRLPPDVRWDDVMMILREQIDRVIAHFGELLVNKVSGVLLATDEGGFISGYIQHKRSANGNH
jgi:SAM-dependent methyltransferase